MEVPTNLIWKRFWLLHCSGQLSASSILDYQREKSVWRAYFMCFHASKNPELTFCQNYTLTTRLKMCVEKHNWATVPDKGRTRRTTQWSDRPQTPHHWTTGPSNWLEPWTGPWFEPVAQWSVAWSLSRSTQQTTEQLVRTTSFWAPSVPCCHHGRSNWLQPLHGQSWYLDHEIGSRVVVTERILHNIQYHLCCAASKIIS